MEGVSDQEVRYRPFEEDDLPALVDLFNAEYPDEPTTLEQELNWERTYPQENPRRRLTVETAAGHMVGFGSSTNPFWMQAEGVYEFYAIIHHEWRRQGIGTALLAQLEPYAREQAARRLWTSAREIQGHTIEWLKAVGFVQYGLRYEAALDLLTFDASVFAGARARSEAAGYRFCTLADWRAEHENADRELFEMYRDGIADCPLPGGAVITPYWETWHAGLSGPTFDPAYVFLAIHGGRIVAMTRMELLTGAPVITEATAVLREHRGHGLATAIKVESLRAVKERGYSEARTHNDTANPSIVHINEKLGYTRISGWTMWEKPL